MTSPKLPVTLPFGSETGCARALVDNCKKTPRQKANLAIVTTRHEKILLSISAVLTLDNNELSPMRNEPEGGAYFEPEVSLKVCRVLGSSEDAHDT